MNIISIKALQTLIEEAAVIGPPQSIFKTFNQNYILRSQIKLHEYDTLTHIGQRINLRHKNKNKNTPSVFGNGELKLFSWVLMLYCQSKEKTLNQFNKEDLINIQQIFKKEEQSRIDYEIRCLSIQKSKQNVAWSQQEIELFTKITQQYKATEWKTIAYLMFKQSNGQFFRSFENYREKWINYLNPNLEKGKWSLEESICMMEIVSKEGRKWAYVSRKLKNSRSEHSIKNHFKKLLREFFKKYKNKQQDSQDIDQRILNSLQNQLKKNQTRDHSQLHLKKDSQQQKESRFKKYSLKIQVENQKQLEISKLDESQLNCLKEQDQEKYEYIYYFKEKQIKREISTKIDDRSEIYYPFLFHYFHP